MKRILYACFILSCSLGLSAQEISQPFKEVIPPSPTVAGLMRFEEVPVNLYTGAPSISIPLFSKPLHSGMGMSVQLSYNTSGIRIDERSGWTGTGWTLMAGGSISRTVKHLPDDINNTGTKVGTFHNNYKGHIDYKIRVHLYVPSPNNSNKMQHQCMEKTVRVLPSVVVASRTS